MMNIKLLSINNVINLKVNKNLEFLELYELIHKNKLTFILSEKTIF